MELTFSVWENSEGEIFLMCGDERLDEVIEIKTKKNKRSTTILRKFLADGQEATEEPSITVDEWLKKTAPQAYAEMRAEGMLPLINDVIGKLLNSKEDPASEDSPEKESTLDVLASGLKELTIDHFRSFGEGALDLVDDALDAVQARDLSKLRDLLSSPSPFRDETGGNDE